MDRKTIIVIVILIIMAVVVKSAMGSGLKDDVTDIEDSTHGWTQLRKS